ncbi:hypothetical protein A3F27_02000 [Candidatus Kaiserbacteria bacterium RIFCSPHIGHO2_12_FULL_53_13]|uniref:Uncharacterized protein n=1 Tax=Candidatus Kaiserbacteria bacterium RIFCSPHIGHO2_12_FULL_53_13 TaxID=1798502 RepID=A0A1F6E873_9BACT|nr:MAG: hypothetical protein A3F27_02000 [Candidatus Kaiserbacteria bacterium RIFCSPHIGHO2_12_FULL_53_13]OGG74362.1 MAG: hypothetical protein A3A37_02745 [Candidatus Kaiserbacteria bacterium RIFCSPLOWO2_01_FULL_52_36]
MTTKVIFNTDKKLKAAAMKKARGQGMTLSAVLNLALRAYVDNRMEIDVLGQMIERGHEDIRRGRTIPAEEVYRRLGLKIR